jgi:lantibiotic modifying enzyme
VAGTEADWSIVDVDIGDDVYSGRAGLAWFLGLAAASGAPGAHGLRRISLDAARAALRAAPSPGGGDGLLVGRTGRLLAAADLGRRLGDAALVEEAGTLARRIAAAASAAGAGGEADLLAGQAGTLLGLLALGPDADDEVLDACLTLGAGLVAGAERHPWGWSWASAADSDSDPDAGSDRDGPALCGLAHGAAGIALGLHHLGCVTGQDHFVEAAREAERYERSWFSQEASNWPDLRGRGSHTDGSAPAYPVFWCHGAAGIGLARLHSAALTGDGAAWAEATAAVTAARVAVAEARRQHAAGLPVDQSLCHGLGGLIELFLVAGAITGRPEHLRAARRTAEVSLAMTAAKGGVFGCGLPDRRETPGLFLGLAGIGLTMLRLHDPSLAPSPALFGIPELPAH